MQAVFSHELTKAKGSANESTGASRDGSLSWAVDARETRALHREVVSLRRELLSFARKQWPSSRFVSKREGEGGGGSVGGDSASEGADASFTGGDFWEAVVAACAETEPFEERVGWQDVETPLIVEYNSAERPLAELVLQLGIMERVQSKPGGPPQMRLKLVDEVFGED